MNKNEPSSQLTSLTNMNCNELNPNKAFVSLYEQMLIQRNLQQQQQQQQQQHKLTATPGFPFHFQNDQLQLQIQANSYSSSSSSSASSSSSSTSSLLSISSKSQQVSPVSSPVQPNDLVLPPGSSSNSSGAAYNSTKSTCQLPPNDYESKYRAYMINAAAAFPYSMFGLPMIHNNNNNNPVASFQNQPTPASLLNNFNNNRQLLLDNFNGLFPGSLNSLQQQQQHQMHLQQQQQQELQQFHNHSQNVDAANCCRMLMKQEEPKPAHSYIGLIALAILSTPEKKLVLSDIYQWILDNYVYFHSRGSGWRNSIRHNLSLNDCFMKSGRSSNGKGHYWTIHPANMEDFSRGDFRRRRAQRRVRKSLGLTLPEEDAEDEEEDDELLTPPSSLSPVLPKTFNNTSNNSSSCSTNSDSSVDKQNSLKRNLVGTEFESGKKKAKLGDVKAFFNSSQSEPIANCSITQLSNNSTHLFQSDEIEEDSNQSESNDHEAASFRKRTISNEPPPLYEQESKDDEEEEQEVISKKRPFNVDSLLAPDVKRHKTNHTPIRLANESDLNLPLYPNSNVQLNILPKSLVNNNNKDKNNNLLMMNSSKKPQASNDAKTQLSPSSKRHSTDSGRQHCGNNNYTHNSKLTSHDQHQNSPFSKLESNNVDVEKWKQTFSKIMARSYKNNSSNNNNTNQL